MTFNFNTPRKSKIPAHLRHDIALKSLKKEQPVTKIATEFGCSRTTVYEQRNVALQAVGKPLPRQMMIKSCFIFQYPRRPSAL